MQCNWLSPLTQHYLQVIYFLEGSEWTSHSIQYSLKFVAIIGAKCFLRSCNQHKVDIAPIKNKTKKNWSPNVNKYLSLKVLKKCKTWYFVFKVCRSFGTLERHYNAYKQFSQKLKIHHLEKLIKMNTVALLTESRYWILLCQHGRHTSTWCKGTSSTLEIRKRGGMTPLCSGKQGAGTAFSSLFFINFKKT